MKQINDLEQKYPEKKLVVVMDLKNPTIVSDFERSADKLLAEFCVQNQTIFDVLSDQFHPQSRLPFQVSKNM